MQAARGRPQSALAGHCSASNPRSPRQQQPLSHLSRRHQHQRPRQRAPRGRRRVGAKCSSFTISRDGRPAHRSSSPQPCSSSVCSALPGGGLSMLAKPCVRCVSRVLHVVRCVIQSITRGLHGVPILFFTYTRSHLGARRQVAVVPQEQVVRPGAQLKSLPLLLARACTWGVRARGMRARA